MTQTIFTYNQEQAIKAGNSSFIAETGAYICRIISAEYVQSQSGALSLELTVETKEGLRGNYLSIYYQGKDGSPLQSGHNMIQAIMGVTRVAELTRQFKDNKAYAPQLEGKYLGLMLQKSFAPNKTVQTLTAFRFFAHSSTTPKNLGRAS